MCVTRYSNMLSQMGKEKKLVWFHLVESVRSWLSLLFRSVSVVLVAGEACHQHEAGEAVMPG